MAQTPARPIPFGDYLLLQRIGVGGTAEIFRAVRRGRRPGDPEVALKRMLPPLAEDPSLVQLFLREIGALDRIDHPAVVRLLDHGETNGLPFLVMPLLDGVSLRRVLVPDPQDDAPVQPLPVPVALGVAGRMAEGLAAAHREGIVHRDVSPANVQCTAQGLVHLLDFGIARVAGMAQTTHGQGLRGKWAYLSPEQIAGGPIDGRSDLFALGSVLVEMLTGRPPFAGSDRHDTLGRIQAARFESVPGLPGAVADELNTLLQALLRHAAQDRPANGDLVAAVLGRMVPGDAWRQTLVERVSAVPRPTQGGWMDAAELRGEQVTDPAMDDVTQVRDEGSP
jgi:serine/threonine protein kinase